jgi:hypothetical protein
MTATSGQYGRIKIGSSNLVECGKWTFDRSAMVHPYRSCGTVDAVTGRLYTKRIEGGSDGTGTIFGLQDPSDAIETYFVEGSSVTLLLYWTTTKYYSVPALIEKLNVEDDIAEGTPVPWNADFGANGKWTIN